MSLHLNLIREINECCLEEGQVAFWWIGQHSFVLKVNDKVLYLDPFISEHHGRLVASPLNASDINNADIIFGSHDHLDHVDRAAWPILAENNLRCTFIVPELIRNKLSNELKIPISQFVGLNDLSDINIDGMKITGIAAAHEFLDKDEASGLFPYLGFIIEFENITVYYSGDTCIYEGLHTKLSKWDIDIAFVPINGRDAVRLKNGCIGNMLYQEAADLCGNIKPGLIVPGHYGMFAKNSVDPSLFYDYIQVKYPDLKVHLPIHAEKLLCTIPRV